MGNCKFCNRSEKGILTEMGSSTTCMFVPPYTDKDGNYHSHNPNVVTTSYKCNCGLSVETYTKHTCPSCDYGKDEERFKIVGGSQSKAEKQELYFEVKTFFSDYAVHFWEENESLSEVCFQVYRASVSEDNILEYYCDFLDTFRLEPNEFMASKAELIMEGTISWRGIWDDRLWVTHDEYDGDQLKAMNTLYNDNILPYCKRFLANKYPEKVGDPEEE